MLSSMYRVQFTYQGAVVLRRIHKEVSLGTISLFCDLVNNVFFLSLYPFKPLDKDLEYAPKSNVYFTSKCIDIKYTIYLLLWLMYESE